MTCGPITFPFGSWSAWQSHGQDTNSVSFFPSPFSNLYLCIYFLFCLYLLFDFSYIIVSVQPLSTLQEQAKYLNTLAQATSKGWVTIDLTKPGLLSVDSPVVSFLPSLPPSPSHLLLISIPPQKSKEKGFLNPPFSTSAPTLLVFRSHPSTFYIFYILNYIYIIT